MRRETIQRWPTSTTQESVTGTDEEFNLDTMPARGRSASVTDETATAAPAPARRGAVSFHGRPRATKTVSPEEAAAAAFNTENAGIINVINNAGTVLSSTDWSAPAPSSGGLAKAITGGEVTGAATGVSGSITNAATGAKDTGETAIGAAGHVVAGVGSSIGALVSSIKAIKKAYEESNEEEAGLVGSTQAAHALLSALRSGFEAAQSIQRFVSGSVSPGIVAAIPGLGIAIAACDVISNAYVAYNAKQAETEMETVSGEFRLELTNLIGIPEDKKTLFAEEKRGKLGNRQEYLRLKPGLFETLDAVAADKTGKLEANFKRMHKIPAAISFTALYTAIKNYEMGSKLQEINQKRKVQGARNILTSVIRIAGEIAKFFPADGGITAGVLVGTSAAIGSAQTVAKLVQGLARDKGIGGGDSTRSKAAKHKEYMNHTRSLFQFLDAIPKPVMPSAGGKVAAGKQLLSATGANVSSIYAADYSNGEAVKGVVGSIVEGMKAGR